MNINITVKLLKQFHQLHNEAQIETAGWHEDDSRKKTVNISKLKSEELDTLAKLAEECKDDAIGWNILNKIRGLRQLRQDPTGKKITKLDALDTAIKTYLKTVPRQWVFEEDEGTLLPAWVSSVRYHKAEYRGEHYTPAYVSLQRHYMVRGDEQSDSTTWHAGDLRGGKTVVEVLQEAGMIPASDGLIATYEKEIARYVLLQPQTGAQFTGMGMALELNSNWGRSLIALVREGIADKLVMDDLSDEGQAYSKDKGSSAGTFWKEEKAEDEETALVMYPVHPIVKLFNLDRHAFVLAHVNQLKEYEWNPKLGEKLILPPGHKDVIDILMHTAAEEIEDIVKGKSGGTICICTGVPGTGKTLTAEVTSEVIKRVLYKVNCSQLGTDEGAIEKELGKTLERATRWGALLLIDEADVYVRARGEDIQQNAIVGVFLRVLEYYRGVLFLTSNMATVIDDAIMSRATVHLKYTKPSKEDLLAIWSVLVTQFKLDIGKDMIHKLVATFPDIVGRDVKNLLKLVVRYCRHKETAPTLEIFKKLAIHKDIKTS